MFGVFDGHGGREVAHYTKQHLEDCITENKHFENSEFGEALRQGFLDIDRQLEDEKGREELATMKRSKPPNKAPLFKLLGEINTAKDGE